MAEIIKWDPVAFPGRGSQSTELDREGHSRYRYWIERRWSDCPRFILWVMFNPSVATIESNGRDAAVPLCFERSQYIAARRMDDIGDVGGMRIVNLFARRSTDTRADGWPEGDALKSDEWIGPDNDAHIQSQVAEAAVLIAAWGGSSTVEKGAQWRADEVERILNDPWCLVPKHPHWKKHPYYAGNQLGVSRRADIVLLKQARQ